MLKLRDINKYYGNFQALKDINLFIEQGEFVAVLGESGSGKSTLLNVISGLDEFESGDITINGISTENFSKREWAIYRNNYVGFVFQEYNLVDHLTVAENVELPLLLQGVAAKEARARALEKCKLLGLSAHANKLPKKISGGQQQRAAIARALVTEPKVILADEPTGALDSENAKIILDILKVLSKDHVVVLVTHDEEFAHQYATRIVTLEDGKIISDTQQKDKGYEANQSINLKRPNMKLKVLWKFAINNLSKRKFRTLFTSLTMSIGLISIFLIIFLINGIRSEVTDMVSSVIPKDQYYVKSEIINAKLSQDDYDYVVERKSVDEAMYQYTIVPLTNEKVGYEKFNEKDYYVTESFNMTGIPTHEKNFFAKNSLTGKYPQSENEIIVSSRVVEVLIGIKNISEDDLDKAFNQVKDREIKIDRVSSSSELNENFKIVGVFYSDSTNLFVLNTKLEKLAEKITDDDKEMYYTYQGNTLVDKTQLVVFLNTNKQNKINELEDDLMDNGLVLKNPTRIIYGSINNFFDTVLYILVGTASVSLLVSGILVGLMIYISVVERIKEIGILTSLGARGGNIRSLFIFESGFIGFLSSFFALVIALLITLIINSIFNNTIGALMRTFNVSEFENFKLLHIDIISIIVVFFVSVIYAIICGLIPAFISSRLNAVEALRKE